MHCAVPVLALSTCCQTMHSVEYIWVQDSRLVSCSIFSQSNQIDVYPFLEIYFITRINIYLSSFGNHRHNIMIMMYCISAKDEHSVSVALCRCCCWLSLPVVIGSGEVSVSETATCLWLSHNFHFSHIKEKRWISDISLQIESTTHRD